MFTVIRVDGQQVIDLSAVEDPETERLKITVRDGQLYVFALVDHGDKGKFMVMDSELSDAEGITHAHEAYTRLRSQPRELAVYFREWNPVRQYETRQPKLGQWLAPLVGYISPARPWSIEGIRHTMLGGQITEMTSTVLEPR